MGTTSGSRSGKKFVGGYFSPQVWRKVKTLAAVEGVTVQELVAEGIQSVFAKRNITMQVVSPKDVEQSTPASSGN